MIAITTLLIVMLFVLNIIHIYTNVNDLHRTLQALLNQNEMKERVPRFFDKELSKDDLLASIYFTVYLDDNENLDKETQDSILDIFKDLSRQGKCIILVSHAKDVIEACDEKIELKGA
ncbi:hypothetical protein [Floccifex sp.]|uniref:hypothetical protein n=1 Tax=Floccifex sp. TaxID=2815810 RepID=UPI003F028B37